MKLEYFAQMRALESAYVSTNQSFVDHLLNADEREGGKLRQELRIKRVQFDAAEALVTELDSVCNLLDVSKRQFLEGAVWEAIERAKGAFFATLDRVGADAGDQRQVQLTVEGGE